MADAPRFKICGLTRLEDAELAVEAGAWALGVILWDGSERRCPFPEAERIARTLRRRTEVCGVFVNATLDEVAGLVDGLGLTMVQLHGDEVIDPEVAVISVEPAVNPVARPELSIVATALSDEFQVTDPVMF